MPNSMSKNMFDMLCDSMPQNMRNSMFDSMFKGFVNVKGMFKGMLNMKDMFRGMGNTEGMFKGMLNINDMFRGMVNTDGMLKGIVHSKLATAMPPARAVGRWCSSCGRCIFFLFIRMLNDTFVLNSMLSSMVRCYVYWDAEWCGRCSNTQQDSQGRVQRHV